MKLKHAVIVLIVLLHGVALWLIWRFTQSPGSPPSVEAHDTP